ncbi:MAG: penicillin acylase family protein [Gemmatimonadales bacterium]
MIRRTLLAVAATLILIVAVAWFGGRAWLARSVAQEAGVASVAGLSAPVQVTFDAKGIPQVWAATSNDAIEALGWLHASERLFQMELIRRVAEGRLAELFGAKALPLDSLARRMGFARRGRQDVRDLDPATRTMLEHYVTGINAWIARAPVLPPEFVLLRTHPAPWTLDDVAAVAIYQTWFASALMDKNAEYRDLLSRLGPSARKLVGAYDEWSPATVPDRKAAAGADRYGMALASNSWVIAPSRSASGAALHESDPHLQTDQAPGLWYIAGLHAKDGLDVVGGTAPGLPFIAMGHNATIAWAFTVAPVHLLDEYREHFAPGDTLRVLTPTGWAPVRVIAESIFVQGEPAPRVLQVLETPRGVVTEHHGDSGVSMHWAGFDFSAASLLAHGDSLMRASDFSTFRRAVTGFAALSVNWTYTDLHGHIGYQLGTPIPIRDTTNAFVLHDAADPNVGWHGYRALDDTPHSYDPAAGWLATCNNQAVPADWPYTLPGFYDDYRIVRAAALLSEKDRWSSTDVQQMQGDVVSVGVLRFRALMASGAEKAGQAELAAKIRGWTGESTAGDTLAALYAYWRRDLTRELFEDELGSRWQEGEPLVDGVVTGNVKDIIDDHRTPEVEDAADISARAIGRAIDEARGRTLGQVQTLTVRHPLSVVSLLNRWLHLTRGPYPMGGDPTTLDASYRAYDRTTGTFRVIVGPSMRFVLDWAQPDDFSMTIPMGESGNPLSPHFDDFLTLHSAGGRWVVPFSRDSVESRAVSVLRLEPER